MKMNSRALETYLAKRIAEGKEGAQNVADLIRAKKRNTIIDRMTGFGAKTGETGKKMLDQAKEDLYKLEKHPGQEGSYMYPEHDSDVWDAYRGDRIGSTAEYKKGKRDEKAKERRKEMHIVGKK